MSVRASRIDHTTYAHQVRQTRQALDTVDDTSLVSLSGLGIPQVQALKQEIAEIFPASNLPSFLLQGLLQLKDRTLPQERVHADLTVLFRGTKQIGIYSTFLAAPALVIYGYQQLLTLAGKDVAGAFPNGLWQFYTEFGLREDSARHSVETVGFQRAWPTTSDLNAATCWVYAAIQLLFAYDDLLANEWHERVMLRGLNEALKTYAVHLLGKKLPRKAEEREHVVAERVVQLRQHYQLERLAADWHTERPFHAPSGMLPDEYAHYRRQCFAAYLERTLRHLPLEVHNAMQQHYDQCCEQDLPAYQQQMTLLMTLRPEPYQDHHEPLALDRAQVALIVDGCYYLFDVCDRDAEGRLLVFPRDGDRHSPGVALATESSDDGSLHDRYGRAVRVDRRGRVRAGNDVLGCVRPPPLAIIKGQVGAVLRQARPAAVVRPPEPLTVDLLLSQTPRESQRNVRAQLDEASQSALQALRHVPIIVNWDRHSSTRPIRDIRYTRHGCGDHALTLIRTERSMVFDLSHIFFDGVWGSMLAEIMTGFALNVHPLVADMRARSVPAPPPLVFNDNPRFRAAAETALQHSPVESAGETTAVDVKALATLRRRLQPLQLALTVNDILLLARSRHAAYYQPGATGRLALEAIGQLEQGADLCAQIERYWEEERLLNPALLIPMDASAVDPKLRLFPATFRNPLPELLSHLQTCEELVRRLRQRADATVREQFLQERRILYSELRTFGAFLQTLREVTMRGENFTTAALRLLGHLPAPMQYIMDLIPQKIGILNEIIKGREVFSNIGQVPATSSVTRFASSRDDGDTKVLVWGIMSDASGQLVITLRDFRPYVAALHHRGRGDLAAMLTQDYVDRYASTVNEIVQGIQRVFAYKEKDQA